MYDYFDILGVSSEAGGTAIRLAERRRLGMPHPDFQVTAPDPDVGTAYGTGPSEARVPVAPTDLSVDFLDRSVLAERMQRAFFGAGH